MKIYKKWWFWATIVVLILVAIFFFPKSCGGGGGIGGPWTSIDCKCFGFVVTDNSMTDAIENYCLGICLKNTCKTTIIYPDGTRVLK